MFIGNSSGTAAILALLEKRAPDLCAENDLWGVAPQNKVVQLGMHSFLSQARQVANGNWVLSRHHGPAGGGRALFHRVCGASASEERTFVGARFVHSRKDALPTALLSPDAMGNIAARAELLVRLLAGLQGMRAVAGLLFSGCTCNPISFLVPSPIRAFVFILVYKRLLCADLLEMSDGGTIAIDWDTRAPASLAAPILLFLPGVHGTHRNTYLRRLRSACAHTHSLDPVFFSASALAFFHVCPRYVVRPRSREARKLGFRCVCKSWRGFGVELTSPHPETW
jgi:hypothetical protein